MSAWYQILESAGPTDRVLLQEADSMEVGAFQVFLRYRSPYLLEKATQRRRQLGLLFTQHLGSEYEVVCAPLLEGKTA